MAGHAEQSPSSREPCHWHAGPQTYPPGTKGVVLVEGLEHRKTQEDPVGPPRRRVSSGGLRHTHSMPVDAAKGTLEEEFRPTGAAGSRQREPPRTTATGAAGSAGIAGSADGDSDGAHAATGNASLGREGGCTAPASASESSTAPERVSLPSAALSPSAGAGSGSGSMKIALVPRLSYQLTPIPTRHATTKSIPHKATTLRHARSHSQPKLSLDIPPKHTPYSAEPVVESIAIVAAVDMATSPTTTNMSRPRQKRVSFTTSEPEIIPQSSKRRQSSVNQRPSWSNVFLLRDPKVRDPVATRSRSLSPGPSILKEVSAFKSDASDAELKKDEHGNEVSVHKVHVSPLYEKNLKRLSRGRKAALPIPQAKVSRNASPRAMSPDRDLSPTSLSARHASPREDTFDKSTIEQQSIVVHPPSPPESDAEDDDEDAIDDSDEQSPPDSRTSSLDDVDDEIDVEAVGSRFSKCDIDGSSHAHRHEPRKDSQDELKSPTEDWRTSRKSSNTSRSSNDDWRTSRKSSNASRKSSNSSRKDSQESNKSPEKPPAPRRRSSSADQAEMWLRRSSIYGVRSSRAPRVPTRLGSLRA